MKNITKLFVSAFFSVIIVIGMFTAFQLPLKTAFAEPASSTASITDNTETETEQELEQTGEVSSLTKSKKNNEIKIILIVIIVIGFSVFLLSVFVIVNEVKKLRRKRSDNISNKVNRRNLR